MVLRMHTHYAWLWASLWMIAIILSYRQNQIYNSKKRFHFYCESKMNISVHDEKNQLSFPLNSLQYRRPSTSSGFFNKTNRIHLLGERNSGTNYIESILKTSLLEEKYGNFSLKYPFASGIPVLDFKHMWRHDLLDSKELKIIEENQDSLWLLVVRSPCSWADGMYRNPGTCAPHQMWPV